MKNEVPSKGLEWTNLLLGMCLGCAAFTFGGVPTAAWNAATVGAVIALCSAIALYRYADWAEWSNLTLGIWAVIAPFALGFGSATGAMLTHIVIGSTVLLIAIIQLLGSSKNRAAAKARRSPAE